MVSSLSTYIDGNLDMLYGSIIFPFQDIVIHVVVAKVLLYFHLCCLPIVCLIGDIKDICSVCCDRQLVLFAMLPGSFPHCRHGG